MLNSYLLPSIYNSATDGTHEIKLAQEILPKYITLRALKSLNTGRKTAILISNTDGYGEYDAAEHISHYIAGLQIGFNYMKVAKSFDSADSKKLIDILGKFAATLGRKQTRRGEVRLFDCATSEDLCSVIQKPDYENIIVVGHSTHHSWRASDKSVSWYDAGMMVDGHLKNGFFANVGCGNICSWNLIPLGYFLVCDHSRLLGNEAAAVYTSGMGNLSKLQPLRKIPTLASLLA